MVLIAQTHANTKTKAAYTGLMTSSTAETYQDVESLTAVRAMPGMMILAPADAIEYGAMILWAPEFAGLVCLRVTQEATPPLFHSLQLCSKSNVSVEKR